LYVLPSVIAAIRGVEGLGWIIVINLLPTGVCWLAALIAAVLLPRRRRTITNPGLAEKMWVPQPPSARQAR